MKGNPLLLFINEWSIGMTLDRNDGLVLTVVWKKLGKDFKVEFGLDVSERLCV